MADLTGLSTNLHAARRSRQQAPSVCARKLEGMGYAFKATLFFLFLTQLVNAQSISTSTPIPPLQWLNLTNLLSGAHPPPLKDAVMGYDETSRSLIIFGGESAGGFPQGQTYLLNLDTLAWSSPSPPTTLSRTPSARSGALGGIDAAASNRHGFVMIGGKGSDGNALSDVWEYDFINQFWSQVQISPGGPSARWGAAGGVDFRTPFISDPVVPGPNNTFYLAGGYDGSSIQPLSDVWMLKMAGTLSSNLPDSAVGSWSRIPLSSKLSPRLQSGSTVIAQKIVSSGGCNTASSKANACASNTSYVIDVDARSSISPAPCPAPRLDPVLIPNVNGFSTRFGSQAFMVLGTFDDSLWQDDGGLRKGEVDVLDINTGSWSRVLPAGDPGSSGNVAFPTPREGASAVSFSSALVGSNRNSFSDTIVFGGRDSDGNYLSEVWLLRAYSGEVSSSSDKWSGFGNGQLQTGPNANGAGVSVTYLTHCASAIASPRPPSSSSSTPTGSAPPSPTDSSAPSQPTAATFFPFDTSILHKLLAPLSLVIFQPAFILLRLAAPTFNPNTNPERHIAWTYLAIVVTIIAYAVGVAGLASSFTSISPVSMLSARSTDLLTLKTGHGQAGLAFFIGLYGLVPVLLAISFFLDQSRASSDDKSDKSTKTNLTGAEKAPSTQTEPMFSRPQSELNVSPPSSPRQRVNSWGPSSMWQRSHEAQKSHEGHRSHEGRLSEDSESLSSVGPQRTFEVLNRPARTRRGQLSAWHSAESTAAMSHQTGTLPRLGDVDWLQRRRSLNAVDELDYAISQASRPLPSTPHTTDALVTTNLQPQDTRPSIPAPFAAFIHILLHIFILGLSIITLVALWMRAPRALFAVFLIWTMGFYVVLVWLSWHGRPEKSILSVILYRLRADPHHPSSEPMTPSSQPLAVPAENEQYPFPSDPRGAGPYLHQPHYHVAMSEYSHAGPRSEETDDDPNEDEDTRQRRIEDEMGRRDVSIVTVPKRKLWIANPS
ncbi:hypothetical protein HGRIS_009986 [Hohenbuehelia grisea]|uniref:Uncharacterized protein n=1 Tax=Hohenbuehelia grisea TaxID=104357 RepID=A0ABR3J2V5_9AGAR